MKKLLLFFLLALSLAACSSKNSGGNSGGGEDISTRIEYYEKVASSGVETLLATFSKGVGDYFDELDYFIKSAEPEREIITLTRYRLSYDEKMDPIRLEIYTLNYEDHSEDLNTFRKGEEGFNEKVLEALSLYRSTTIEENNWIKVDQGIRTELYKKVDEEKTQVENVEFKYIIGYDLIQEVDYVQRDGTLQKQKSKRYKYVYNADNYPTKLTVTTFDYTTSSQPVTEEFEVDSPAYLENDNYIKGLHNKARQSEDGWVLVGTPPVVPTEYEATDNESEVTEKVKYFTSKGNIVDQVVVNTTSSKYASVSAIFAFEYAGSNPTKMTVTITKGSEENRYEVTEAETINEYLTLVGMEKYLPIISEVKYTPTKPVPYAPEEDVVYFTNEAKDSRLDEAILYIMFEEENPSIIEMYFTYENNSPVLLKIVSGGVVEYETDALDAINTYLDLLKQHGYIPIGG